MENEDKSKFDVVPVAKFNPAPLTIEDEAIEYSKTWQIIRTQSYSEKHCDSCQLQA